jgi:hypothetical protein
MKVKIYSLTDLHNALGSKFEGEAITKINDTISVGLSLEVFTIFMDGKAIDTATPGNILSKLNKII